MKKIKRFSMSSDCKSLTEQEQKHVEGGGNSFPTNPCDKVQIPETTCSGTCITKDYLPGKCDGNYLDNNCDCAANI